MKKTFKTIISLVCTAALMLSAACLFASAEASHIELDGEVFRGTLAEAIDLADDNSVIDIVGTVATEPISKNAAVKLNNINIYGANSSLLTT